MAQELLITIPGFMTGLAFFLSAASSWVMEEYTALYFDQLGYNALFTGLLPSLGIVSQLVGVPLLTYLADKFRARKASLFLSIIVTTICDLSFKMLRRPQLICDGIALNATGKISASFNGTDSTITWSRFVLFSSPSNDAQRLKFFLVFWLLRGVWELSRRMCYTMIAVAAVTHLKQNATKFGKYKSWSNVGGGASVFAFGVISHFVEHNVCGVLAPYYSLMFFYIAGLQILSLITLPWLKFEYLEHKVIDYKEVKRVFTQPHYIFILVIGIHYGVCLSFIGRWEFWYIARLGGSPLIMAVAGLMRHLSCFVSFFLGNRIIDKFGELKTLAFSLLVFAVCFGSLSLLRNPWFVVLFTCVQAASFSLSFSSIVVHFSNASTKASSAFFQGLAILSVFGIGQGVNGFTIHYAAEFSAL